jgi:hypothetical protein
LEPFSKACPNLHRCADHGFGTEGLGSGGIEFRGIRDPFDLELLAFLAQASLPIHPYQLHHPTLVKDVREDYVVYENNDILSRYEGWIC